jgi:hypothetical protein
VVVDEIGIKQEHESGERRVEERRSVRSLELVEVCDGLSRADSHLPSLLTTPLDLPLRRVSKSLAKGVSLSQGGVRRDGHGTMGRGAAMLRRDSTPHRILKVLVKWGCVWERYG